MKKVAGVWPEGQYCVQLQAGVGFLGSFERQTQLLFRNGCVLMVARIGAGWDDAGRDEPGLRVFTRVSTPKPGRNPRPLDGRAANTLRVSAFSLNLLKNFNNDNTFLKGLVSFPETRTQKARKPQ